jgi:hypothetical protein
MSVVGLEYPYRWIKMRNEESILASSWTWILGSRSSVVLSACNYYKACYKWGEDASSSVAAGKVSIVYPFQGIQSVFTFITTDHRCEISHGIDYLSSCIPDFELLLVCAVFFFVGFVQLCVLLFQKTIVLGFLIQ